MNNSYETPGFERDMFMAYAVFNGEPLGIFPYEHEAWDYLINYCDTNKRDATGFHVRKIDIKTEGYVRP